MKPSILVFLAVLPYLRCLRGEFLFDDPYLFMDDGPLGVIYRSVRQFRGDRRAMVHLFDSWLWRLFQINDTGKDTTGTVIVQPALPWHALSVLMHAGTTLAVYGLLSLVLSDFRAFLAAAVFAVHPLQVMAVGYVSGRAGVQAWFFACLGLLHASMGGLHWLAVPACQYFSYKSKQDGLLYLAFYPVILWLKIF